MIMSNTVLIKTYSAPPVDRAEILRYAGVKERSPEIDALLEDCLREYEGKIQYRICYTELSVKVCGDEIDLSFAKVGSNSLALNLSGCERIVLFCATIGAEADRIISKYSYLSPSREVMLGAIGSERVEALCDAFCDDVREAFASVSCSVRPRFSPGYGDLSIDLQADIFRAIDPAKRIGVFLNESMMMSPSKSVTAIIGVKKDK